MSIIAGRFTTVLAAHSKPLRRSLVQLGRCSYDYLYSRLTPTLGSFAVIYTMLSGFYCADLLLRFRNVLGLPNSGLGVAWFPQKYVCELAVRLMHGCARTSYSIIMPIIIILHVATASYTRGRFSCHTSTKNEQRSALSSAVAI
ncbi:hypothetical protein BC835DRAFT_1395228 [Cytidiella melzeri]|nr:hypothetical protein BC835DRAFT_1395228 [Cytidiella melzeri]